MAQSVVAVAFHCRRKKTARVFTPGVRSLACVWRSVLLLLFDGLVSGFASSFPEPMLSLNP